jgi:hypothetical protein
MILSTLMINTDHPALENAKEALDRIGCRLTACIFAAAVVDGLMVCKVLA